MKTCAFITLFLTMAVSIIGWLAYSEKRKRGSLQALLGRLLQGGQHHDDDPPF